jgi:hypothetical protein
MCVIEVINDWDMMMIMIMDDALGSIKCVCPGMFCVLQHNKEKERDYFEIMPCCFMSL